MTTPPQLNPTPELDASFGIIPLTKKTGSWCVFIIRQANGNRWDFPKGHPSSLVRAFSSASYAGQVPSLPSEADLSADKKAPVYAFWKLISSMKRKLRRAQTMDKPNNKTETPQETAERELREETGLTVARYLPVEPFATRYLCVSHGKYVDKTVTYFVAEAEGTVTLCPKEIVEGAWVTLEEASQKMQFPEMKAIVETLASCLDRNAF